MPTDFLSVKKALPVLGVGLGLRRDLFEDTVNHASLIDWLEIVPENFMGVGGKAKENLMRASADFPLVSHGVNLSIGSCDPLNGVYLKELKELLDRLDCPWWSDHLCFSSSNGMYMHDLLPLPYTRETVRYVVERIRSVQDYTERPFLIENISCYMSLPDAEMSEPEFLSEVLERADCGLLLDVNNVYVNSVNFGFDPYQYIDSIPLERTVQMHIAGHKRRDEIIIDTHGAAITDAVYDLLKYAVKRSDARAVLLERDQNFPCFDEIVQELGKIRAIFEVKPVEPNGKRQIDGGKQTLCC